MQTRRVDWDCMKRIKCHNDCLWCVDYNTDVRSPMWPLSQLSRPNILNICLRARKANSSPRVFIFGTMIVYGVLMTTKLQDYRYDFGGMGQGQVYLKSVLLLLTIIIIGTMTAYSVKMTKTVSYCRNDLCVEGHGQIYIVRVPCLVLVLLCSTLCPF